MIVRLNRRVLRLQDDSGESLNPLVLARRLRERQSAEWPAWVRTAPGQCVPGRLIVVRRSRPAADRARKKLQQTASKKQRRVSDEAREAAGYFFVWTSLPVDWRRAQILDLYRCRWQIELAFKRMKSLMGLGHLPKKDPASCRAWLHGKLFAAMLVERMIGAAKQISPWGYGLETPTQPMA